MFSFGPIDTVASGSAKWSYIQNVASVVPPLCSTTEYYPERYIDLGFPAWNVWYEHSGDDGGNPEASADLLIDSLLG